jgi:hypothetical protein
MANTPTHHIAVGGTDKSFALSVRLGQHGGDSTAKTGFFGNNQAHSKQLYFYTASIIAELLPLFQHQAAQHRPA